MWDGGGGIAYSLKTFPLVAVQPSGVAIRFHERLQAERLALREGPAAGNRLELFTRATSLGGPESLIEHRASVEGPTTISPRNLLRISVGLENARDLVEDLERALGT